MRTPRFAITMPALFGPILFGLLGILGTLAACTAAGAGEKQEEPFALRDGDRVVLLGATFIERMQTYGYLETLLTAGQPDKDLRFRNLGWSGDTVQGIARALFGSPADGFQRLRRDVEAAEPTVLLVAYGANEAHEGETGLEQFTAGLGRLLDALQGTGARIVLLSPLPQEPVGPPLPDPQPYNQDLRAYSEAMSQLARQRGCHYLDLAELPKQLGGSDGEPPQRLTDNGLHLTAFGYWRLAPLLAQRLGVSPWQWNVDLDTSGTVHEAVGTSVSDLQAEGSTVRFAAEDRRLPLPPPPAHSPPGARQAEPRGMLRVRGLEPGNYELRVDDQPLATAGHQQWATGVPVPSAGTGQVEQLRQTIREKNELYFHRYRPQNETYLFLFRKHEQGNNAREIPQFDPLVDEQEQQIARLKQPRKQHYQLVPLP